MSDQSRSTFERHPHYDLPAGGATTTHVAQPPTHTPSGGARGTGGGLGGLLGWIGAALAVLTVVMAYVIMRWVDDPATVFVVFVAAMLIVLAVLALLAGRRGGLAPFVAIALTLPFFTVLSAGLGLGERISDGLEDIFGTSDGDSSGSFSFDTDADDDAEAGAEEAVALGEEGTSGNFTVVVSGVECTDTLPQAQDNPDYYTSDNAPEYLDATAPKGKQFCVVSSTWTNSSKEPDMVWSGFGKVVTSDGTQYAPTDDDSSYSSRLSAQAGYESSTLNPGDVAEVRSVFTLPADVEVTHAIAEGFGFDEPAVWFATS